MTTIREHLDKLFSKEVDKDAANKYLEVIRANLRDCVAAFERRIWSLVAVLIALELLAQSAVSEFSFLGLKLGNLTFIQKALPAVAAYLFYSLATIVSYRRLLEEVHDAMMCRLLPNYYAESLQFYAHPPTVFHIEKVISSEAKGRFASALNSLTAPLLVTFLFGPAVFIVYAQVRSFRQFGLGDPLVWISTVITALFLPQGSFQFEGVNWLTLGPMKKR
jgi:hypothetical protein